MTIDARVELVTSLILPTYAALSRSEYGDSSLANEAHLHWKLLDNPEGPATAVNLYKNKSLIGRVIVLPRRFTVENQSFICGYIVDLLIHPNHRDPASLVRLVRQLKDLKSFDCMLVTPNSYGIPIWRDLVKLESPFQLDVICAPLQPLALIGRASGAQALAKLVSLDSLWSRALALAARQRSTKSSFTLSSDPQEFERAAELLHNTMKTPSAHGHRDARFARWRFLASPIWRYEPTVVLDGGRALGYVVTRFTTYLGYRVLVVLDACVGEEHRAPEIGRTLRWLLVQRGLETGAELVLFIGKLASPSLNKLFRFPLLRVPVRFLPQSTPAFLRWDNVALPPPSPGCFHLTPADFDMF